MLIRAYRIRGHFHAKLDPLGLEPEKDERGSSIRASYGFTEADMDPQDLSSTRCWASSSAPCARSSRSCAAPTARRSASSSCTSRIRAEGVDPGAHRRRATRKSRFTREGKRAILNKLVEAGRLREVLRRQVHRHQALRPRRRRIADPRAGADHQARRQSRREGDRARHAASRPPQRADAGDGQAAPRAVPRIQGRLGRRPTRSKAPAT